MLFGLIVFWQMRVYYIDLKMTCLSERSLPPNPLPPSQPPAPFVALLCVFSGTALEPRVLHIWADTSQRLKTSKQTHPRVTFPATVCGTLNKTWQTSDATRRENFKKTNVCFGAKQNPENHFAPHARLSCEALFSRWDVTRGAYQAFKAQCWQLKKLPSTTAAGRTAVWRMKRAFDFGFV